jgi:hypothetical protein
VLPIGVYFPKKKYTAPSLYTRGAREEEGKVDEANLEHDTVTCEQWVKQQSFRTFYSLLAINETGAFRSVANISFCRGDKLIVL